VLFWDRDYKQRGGGVRNLSKQIVSDACYKGQTKGFQHYQSKQGEQQYDYYLNYNLLDEHNLQSDKDFIIQMTTGSSF
jgi:hypothetical protein